MMKAFFFCCSLKDWALIIGSLATLVGIVKGLVEYGKNNRIKRVEFLEKLILEFNLPKMFLAKRILDDFWIEINGSIEISDADLVKLGSKETIEKKDLTDRVKNLLRDHKERSVIGYGEQQARQSFDELLDFFTKLDYYLGLKLIAKEELVYFRYYFERCAHKADGAVMNYAATYGYTSLPRLLAALGIESKKI